MEPVTCLLTSLNHSLLRFHPSVGFGETHMGSTKWWCSENWPLEKAQHLDLVYILEKQQELGFLRLQVFFSEAVSVHVLTEQKGRGVNWKGKRCRREQSWKNVVAWPGFPECPSSNRLIPLGSKEWLNQYLLDTPLLRRTLHWVVSHESSFFSTFFLS